MGWLIHYLAYIGLGVSLAAPIGPINTEMLKRGLHRGFWSSWKVGLGGMSADILWMIAIVAGLGQLLSTPFLLPCLYVSGSAVFIYLGVDSFRQSRNLSMGVGESSARMTQSSSYWSGFAIALLNPLNLLFWTSIYGTVVGEFIIRQEWGQIAAYSTAIIFGIAIWNLNMAFASHYTRRFLTEETLRKIMIAAGLGLIGFGGYFLYKCVLLLAN